MTSKTSAFLGFVAASAGIGVLAAGIITPTLAVANVISEDGVNVFETMDADIPIIDLQSKSTIYDKNGNVIASFFDKNRVPVQSDEISQFVKDAAVAVENPRFYEDSGVDVMAAARALVQNRVSGSNVGASTITMQVVRNTLEEIAENEGDTEAAEEAKEVSMDRKLREMRIALAITKKYTKDQILTQYLNIAFFGGTVYGIEAAAKYYFNVSAEDLSLPQAALLAGMFKQPNKYAPDNPDNIQAATDRRNYVLDKMLEHGYIDQAAHDEAVETKVTVDVHPTRAGCAAAGYNAFFCEYVVAVIKKDEAFGSTAEERYLKLLRGGLKITTTLDPKLQKAAYKASVRYQPPGHPFGTASTSVQVGTGAILAMAQNRSYDYNAKKDNYKTTAINYNVDRDYGGSIGFQSGSTYKVYTLIDWFANGHSASEVLNAPVTTLQQSDFPDRCEPGGWGGTWKLTNSMANPTNLTVRQATIRSVNTGFAAMAKQLDLCDIRDVAIALGVHNGDGSELDHQPSSIIGSGANIQSPLTMAASFAGIANNGVYCTPIAISSVVDSRTGESLPVPQSTCTQAISADVAAATSDVLKDVITGITAGGADPGDGVPVAGKTGTYNNAEQNWLVGYSTNVATATWSGDPSSGPKINGYTRGYYVYKNYIWRDIMISANKIYGGDAFPTPSQALTKGVTTPIPNVVGMSEANAIDTLEKAGFNATVGDTVDSAVTAGLVARTSPGSGASAAKGSSVTVYLSRGNLYEIPNIDVGTNVHAAEDALKSAGFAVTIKYVDNANRVDQVISMSPKGGTEAKKGATVRLTVGRAPANDSSSESPTPEP